MHVPDVDPECLFSTKHGSKIHDRVHEFKVEMTCGGCSNAVQKVLGKLGDKVEELNIDLDTRTVLVKSSMSADELLQDEIATKREKLRIREKELDITRLKAEADIEERKKMTELLMKLATQKP
ncbi:Copper transport protein ATOX1 [Pseudolycoriella hygida]|uniref:Copper transport protein ATOX1 n=1 Tax=Pseudolycoriella hygida TaxID=35572 RepID=A0A9Q0NCR7_9DIPT|nr:Copper transport protein ATOX1 [Pseudolycoriella hygida]